jgi:hypothetical protein
VGFSPLLVGFSPPPSRGFQSPSRGFQSPSCGFQSPFVSVNRRLGFLSPLPHTVPRQPSSLFFHPHISHSSSIMTSPLDHTNSVRISALSHQAVPGSAVSNNPFMTSTPPPKTPRNARDVPPHQVVRTKIPRFPTAFNQTYGSLLSTDDNEADTSSSSSTSESRPSTPTRPPARQPLLWPGVPDPK